MSKASGCSWEDRWQQHAQPMQQKSSREGFVGYSAWAKRIVLKPLRRRTKFTIMYSRTGNIAVQAKKGGGK